MDRREMMRLGIGTAACGGGAVTSWLRSGSPPFSEEIAPPSFVDSVIPVVADGNWIWAEPPENETGYLEPREYELKIGVRLEGTGNATQLAATTPVPVELPEQKIDRVRIQTEGCAAKIRKLAPEASQLILGASSLVRGQVIGAVAHFRLTLFKQYHGFQRDQFPASQRLPRTLQKQALRDSPGIQTRTKQVRQLAAELGEAHKHPWDTALAFKEWVWQNIQGQIGRYTSVTKALRDRVGDCEERAAVFVALCRAAGIPARLVWIPNHNWAEFYLLDGKGQGHWIPAHTACYSWFGWTGAHELVLQKGDNIPVPEFRRRQRLVPDWMKWKGSRPKVHYVGELTPLPSESGGDAGPGARRKTKNGQWQVVGNHRLDKKLRDGSLVVRRTG